MNLLEIMFNFSVCISKMPLFLKSADFYYYYLFIIDYIKFKSLIPFIIIGDQMFIQLQFSILLYPQHRNISRGVQLGAQPYLMKCCPCPFSTIELHPLCFIIPNKVQCTIFSLRLCSAVCIQFFASITGHK